MKDFFLKMAAVLLPWIDEFIGSSRENAFTFLKLRGTCSAMKGLIRMVVTINPWKNLCWWILLLNLQRSKPIRYIIDRRSHGCDTDEQLSRWAHLRFSDIVDNNGNTVPTLRPAPPLPKSAAKSVRTRAPSSSDEEVPSDSPRGNDPISNLRRLLRDSGEGSSGGGGSSGSGLGR